MSEVQAEIMILTLNALGAGLLMFISGVLQRIMNEMDELEFKRFLNKLDRTAMSDPFAVAVASVPILAVLAYFILFGFGQWWFTAGVAVWVVGSAMTKVVNMPIYQWVADENNTDRAELAEKRRKLQFGNHIRAWTTLASVILMACQFGPIEVALTIVACVVLAVPFLWLARRYTPGVPRAVTS